MIVSALIAVAAIIIACVDGMIICLVLIEWISDFGQTVNFGHQNVKSIFGPIIQSGNTINTEKIIHFVTAHLHIIIIDDLFVLHGRCWSQPVRGSLCTPFSICVASNQNYSDIVLDLDVQ